MIWEDRELLAQLARLGRDMAPLALRIMEGSANSREQQDYAERLIAAGECLRKRAGEPAEVVIDGEVLTNGPLTLPELTIGSHRES